MTEYDLKALSKDLLDKYDVTKKSETIIGRDVMVETVSQIETDIKKEEIINYEDSNPLKNFGLENIEESNVVHLIDLSKNSSLKKPSFSKNSKVNADTIWGKTSFFLKKKEGLHSILKEQNTNYLSDFLFIFHRKDFEAISESSMNGRLDYGSEEIDILMDYYKNFMKGNEPFRDFHAVITDQNALWGLDSILQQGKYFIVCPSNFYIPGKAQSKIAQLIIKGKVSRKVRGLGNIYGKIEKYLYHSQGQEILEESYPIYTKDVDFKIDRTMFDNLTILDIPVKRHIAIIWKDNKWTIQAMGQQTQEDGVLRLDEQGEWFLTQDDDASGGFTFQICKGGYKDANKIVEGTFKPVVKVIKSPEIYTKPKPKTVLKQAITESKIIKEESNNEESGTVFMKGRTPSKANVEYHPTIMMKGRKPGSNIIQEFVLTHRLIPLLNAIPNNPDQEFVIPVGPTCEYIVDDQEAWLNIILSYKDLNNNRLEEDSIKLIPANDQKLYILGESNIFPNTIFTFTEELLEKNIILVDKPGISNKHEANFYCELDFKNVPQINGSRFHWCQIKIEPQFDYGLTNEAAIIGRGCYRASSLDLIPEGFWDAFREKYFRMKKVGENTEKIEKQIAAFGHMDIMSSRYHGLFLKNSQSLYNLSLAAPIFIFGKDGKQKQVINNVDKKKLPEETRKIYQNISKFEKSQLENLDDRKKLINESENFIAGSNGLIHQIDLLKETGSACLETGDSIVIGQSKYVYFKRPANKSRDEILGIETNDIIDEQNSNTIVKTNDDQSNEQGSENLVETNDDQSLEIEKKEE